VLGALEKAGLFNKKRKVFVCQELTLEGEKIIRISSHEDIENIETKYREIIVMIRDVDE
jgi:16S rRNA C1402 (ribose-2'-O) methylase RsmI